MGVEDGIRRAAKECSALLDQLKVPHILSAGPLVIDHFDNSEHPDPLRALLAIAKTLLTGDDQRSGIIIERGPHLARIATKETIFVLTSATLDNRTGALRFWDRTHVETDRFFIEHTPDDILPGDHSYTNGVVMFGQGRFWFIPQGSKDGALKPGNFFQNFPRTQRDPIAFLDQLQALDIPFIVIGKKLGDPLHLIVEKGAQQRLITDLLEPTDSLVVQRAEGITRELYRYQTVPVTNFSTPQLSVGINSDGELESRSGTGNSLATGNQKFITPWGIVKILFDDSFVNDPQLPDPYTKLSENSSAQKVFGRTVRVLHEKDRWALQEVVKDFVPFNQAPQYSEPARLLAAELETIGILKTRLNATVVAINPLSTPNPIPTP